MTTQPPRDEGLAGSVDRLAAVSECHLIVCRCKCGRETGERTKMARRRYTRGHVLHRLFHWGATLCLSLPASFVARAQALSSSATPNIATAHTSICIVSILHRRLFFHVHDWD